MATREWKWKSLSRVWLLVTTHGILQARILEWVAFPLSRGSSQLRDQESLPTELSEKPTRGYARVNIISYLLFSHSVMSNSLQPHTAACQVSLSFTIFQVFSNSSPLSQWHHLIFSFTVTLFPSCSQSFPLSGSFPMSRLFRSGDQSIGASASASVLLIDIQGWFPLG